MFETGNLIELTNEDGQVFNLVVLFTFTDETTEEKYVVVKSNEDDEDKDSFEVTALRYVEHGEDDVEFFNLETEEEWEVVQELLDQFIEEQEELDEGDK
jgi:uncharacterized protein YrzB (UPF0473 family)